MYGIVPKSEKGSRWLEITAEDTPEDPSAIRLLGVALLTGARLAEENSQESIYSEHTLTNATNLGEQLAPLEADRQQDPVHLDKELSRLAFTGIAYLSTPVFLQQIRRATQRHPIVKSLRKMTYTNMPIGVPSKELQKTARRANRQIMDLLYQQSRDEYL